jgi:hypothetical protein
MLQLVISICATFSSRAPSWFEGRTKWTVRERHFRQLCTLVECVAHKQPQVGTARRVVHDSEAAELMQAAGALEEAYQVRVLNAAVDQCQTGQRTGTDGCDDRAQL